MASNERKTFQNLAATRLAYSSCPEAGVCLSLSPGRRWQVENELGEISMTLTCHLSDADGLSGKYFDL